MKIDYPNIKNPDGLPFVRLYDFQRSEAQKLRQIFQALASGSLQHAALQDLTTVTSVDGTELSFTLSATDKGVSQIDERRFDFSMTSEGWLNVAGLTDAFCDQSYLHGFQWLGQSSRTKIDLLLSPNGDW